MIKKRYIDTMKLITNIDNLTLTDEGDVLIYCGDEWYIEVSVDLHGKEERFEQLKPMIVYLAKNLCNIDMIAQKYSALDDKDDEFVYNYEIAYIDISALDEISVTYYGMRVNTQFEVVFQCVDNQFLLKSFGTRKNIPLDWDKE